METERGQRAGAESSRLTILWAFKSHPEAGTKGIVLSSRQASAPSWRGKARTVLSRARAGTVAGDVPGKRL